MKLINPGIKEITSSKRGKKIEYAGRMCYKSQDKITESSYQLFIKNIVSRGHTSVLEHESFSINVTSRKVFNKIRFVFENKSFPNGYFNVSASPYNKVFGQNSFIITSNIRGWYDLLTSILYSNNNKIVAKRLYKVLDYFKAISSILSLDYGEIFISYKDNKFKFFDFAFILYDLDELMEFLPRSEAEKHSYKTFHITTDRAVTHQIVRHRRNSFSQESQRYVNYSLDKFGSSIRFILPYSLRKNLLDKNIDSETVNIKNIDDTSSKEIIKQCKSAEKAYFALIESDLKPEVARCILPNMTVSEIVTTATVAQWRNFLSLRCDPHAQDDIREIANLIRDSIG